MPNGHDQSERVARCPGPPRCLHCPCCECQVRVEGVCLDCKVQAAYLGWTVAELMAAGHSENDGIHKRDEIGRRWNLIERQKVIA